MAHTEDSAALRKERGAFFTPETIADYLAEWAVSDDPAAKILDPTCGEAVFLLSAGRKLLALGRDASDLDEQLFGVDLHKASLDAATDILESHGVDAHFLEADFFDVGTPDHLIAPLPYMDAVIGNPPFIRYHRHIGDARDKSRQAALRQQVRLSGLASSWAALLVHACGFLKPEGRLAMVLPAELLTVGYAEPVRAWLRQRFEQVHLVLFEHLQFEDALEKVILVLASGSGGCDAFSLYSLSDAEELATIRPMTNLSVTPADSGKWTELLIPNPARRLFKSLIEDSFVPLRAFGRTELGTVTGANNFFTLTEDTRRAYKLVAEKDVVPVCPPGTKHLRGTSFSANDWNQLQDNGERVWMLYPTARSHSPGLQRYLQVGVDQSINTAYKCSKRTPWWRPPMVTAPDLFFTYMSHRYPRLIRNRAGATFVNSMHGLTLNPDVPEETADALPFMALNSVSLLGAEVFGRAYGGGILKMEPSEAAQLPVPPPAQLRSAWVHLAPDAEHLESQLVAGEWEQVTRRIDEVLLRRIMGLSPSQVERMQSAVQHLRSRRLA